MLNRFKNHIEKERLFNGKQSLLLAISGGLDSVVLCHLLKNCGYTPLLAHCNFQLRGTEAEADEHFVRELAKQLNLEFFSQRFETAGFATENKMSIQMAARKLRYDWFDELMKEKKLDVLLTAHHLNDNLETFLLNFTRGTGMKGLRGIPAKAGKTVRPLLIFERAELEDYAKENNLAFREDSSNYDEKYARNLIRQNVIPALKKLNPSLEQTFQHNLNAITPVFEMAEDLMEEKKKLLVKKKQGYDEIDMQLLQREKQRAFFLFDLLSSYGFNGAQCEDALQLITSLPGKKIESAEYVLLRDRDSFLIRKKKKQVYHELVIEDFPSTVLLGGMGIRFSVHAATKPEPAAGKNTAYFDLDKLNDTCMIRPWKEGDRFRPVGLAGSKKLSDFFVSEKMNLFDKEDCRLLVCGEAIVWIIGRRADERFIAGPDTKRILKAELI